METGFYITVNLKCAKGFESFARFYLGKNKKASHNIFSQLVGSKDVTDKSMLQLEFVELVKGLPVNINMLSCTLEELGINCKIITKELFKISTLEKHR
jgi:hypothetical protein